MTPLVRTWRWWWCESKVWILVFFTLLIFLLVKSSFFSNLGRIAGNPFHYFHSFFFRFSFGFVNYPSPSRLIPWLLPEKTTWGLFSLIEGLVQEGVMVGNWINLAFVVEDIYQGLLLGSYFIYIHQGLRLGSLILFCFSKKALTLKCDWFTKSRRVNWEQGLTSNYCNDVEIFILSTLLTTIYFLSDFWWLKTDGYEPHKGYSKFGSYPKG